MQFSITINRAYYSSSLRENKIFYPHPSKRNNLNNYYPRYRIIIASTRTEILNYTFITRMDRN